LSVRTLVAKATGAMIATEFEAETIDVSTCARTTCGAEQ